MEINTNKFINIKELMNNKYFNETRYTQFVRLIMTESNIKKFNDLFEEYKNIHLQTIKNLSIEDKDIVNIPSINKQNTKKFISLYLILFYPTIINIDCNKATARELVNVGKKLNAVFKFNVNYFIQLGSKELELNDIKNINNYTKLFYTNLNQYNELFDKWKRLDLEGLIYELATSYYALENDFEKIKDEYMERYLDILRKNEVDESQLTLEYKEKFFEITYDAFIKEKEEYIKKVRSIDKNNGEQKFNEYYTIIKNKNAQSISEYENDDDYINKLGQLINKNMEESKWDEFESNLSLDPPILDGLINYIQIIKRSILVCAPRREKEEIKTELDLYMDINYIKHKIEYKIFSNDDLLQLITYIIDKLKKYQAGVDDPDTFIFEENLQLLFKNNTQVRVIRTFIAWIIPRLDKIIRLKYEFFKMLDSNRI